MFSNAAQCICIRACRVYLKNTKSFILLNPTACLELIQFLQQDVQLSGKSCTAQRCQSCSITPKSFTCALFGKQILREFPIHSVLNPLGTVSARTGSVKCGSFHRHYHVSQRLSDIWLNKKMNHCHPFRGWRTKSMSRMV